MGLRGCMGYVAVKAASAVASSSSYVSMDPRVSRVVRSETCDQVCASADPMDGHGVALDVGSTG